MRRLELEIATGGATSRRLNMMRKSESAKLDGAATRKSRYQ